MPSPFPGMDPWLERPGLWPDVHDSLIMGLRRALVPLVRPRYYVTVRQRNVIAVASPEPNIIIPDVAVIERDEPSPMAESSLTALAEPIAVEVPVPEMIPEDYLEIVNVADNRVITVIEILSPSNKSPGEDRKRYESKRNMLFRSDTNLVEIDLLRDGEPMPFTFLQSNGHLSHYRILVKRGDFGRRAYLYPFSVRDPIPNFPLPLQPGDVEPPVHPGKVLKEIYDEGGYDLYIDYSQPPEPPLSEADMSWAREVLRTAKAAHL